jgi:two-component system chemotaxis response regulator CheY
MDDEVSPVVYTLARKAWANAPGFLQNIKVSPFRLCAGCAVHVLQEQGRMSNPENIKMKPRVLIVDDDAAITQQLFWTLCDTYEVMTANDLPTALRRATVYEPALSILDLHLPPALDSPEVGMRILGYIKDRFPLSKVLVMSSAATTEMQQACFDNGADEFLPKPFETAQLLATVRRYAPECSLEALV